MGLNNINTEAAKAFLQQAQADPKLAKKTKRVEGVWMFAEGAPQFKATLAFQAGECQLESDFAPFMGGWGRAPDPIQYCLYGLAACYAGTFVSFATMEGVRLHALRIVVENSLDLTRTLGLSSAPIVERVDVTLTVDGEASCERIEEIERMARERCPAVFCLTHPIPLRTQLEIREHG